MDLQAIQKVMLALGRQIIEEKIEDSKTDIENKKRAIQRHKRTLKLFDAFAKELAKPPKAFKFPKLSKAQLKKQREMLRQAGMPVMPTAIAVQ